ncbi:trigger factor [Synoicihabitans lomoniglobus]|uniref:Trigger factor n=1 Tax=Synoicihabitans lomoniglobus TaxID=2909285 RepID=A0AAF0I736_9BACT|nr:trigger factor [Opitutaceae bacterium LMO-M01]WED66466.1 trigger factor [Opitutaceae bacterium LMO-M01]
MNIQTQDVSETRKSLVASFEAAEVTAEYQAVVAEFTKMARLPGFRPGKAPVAMVTKRYAKDINEEFRKKVVTKAYQDAMSDSKLEVLNVINVEEGEIAPDQAAEITITLDVQPTFELPDYEGIATTVEATDATDDEVEKTLEHMRSERADFNVAERPAQKSDYVKLAYEGTIDGTPILEIAPEKQIYGKVPQTWEEVEGENEGLIPGLGAQLGGLSAGDKKDITITFPAEFAAVEALAGKQAVYAVEVQEVRERILPAIDEEFCKAHQADDEAGLRTNIRNNIKMQKEGRNRSEQRRQVTEAMLSKVTIAAPESLVEQETQGVLRQFIDQQMRQGVKPEQLESDKEALYANARKAAETRVQSQLLLAKIAEKEKVKVEENDMNQVIYQQAMQSGQAPDKFVKELTKNRDRLRSLQQSILFDKTLDLVVSKATVTEGKPAAE